MSIKNSNSRLSITLAKASLAIVCLCGFTLAAIQIFLDFESQKQSAEQQITESIKISSKAAARAAFQLDDQLASQVVQGLGTNPIVSKAVLVDDVGVELAAYEATFEPNQIWIIEQSVGKQSKYREILDNGGPRSVGYLEVVVDNNQIFAEFYHRALSTFLTVLGAALLLGIALFAVSYKKITLPLNSIANKLCSIDISDEKDAKIHPLKGHEKDELGQIVDSANILIGSLVSRQESLLQREQELQVILDANPYPIFAINEFGHIVFTNKATLDFWGKSRNEIVGCDLGVLHAGINNDEYKALQSDIEKIKLSGDDDFLGQHELTDTHGKTHTMQFSIIPFMLFDSPSLLINTTDVSARVKAEERVEKLAYYDVLTDLPNRNQVNEQLRQDIAASKLDRVFGAVVFVDLDDFKRINDSRGHSFGDRLLQKIANKIKSRIRNTETLARLGGDEFILSVPDLSDDESKARQKASDLASRLLDTIREPITIDNDQFIISASIGVALYADGETVEELLQHADTAMYRAKRNGRDDFEIFQPIMAEENKRIVELEAEIREAIVNENFTFYIQPLINSGDTSLASGEALLRWEHPVKGLIMPGDFIEFLEQSTMINDVGDFILEKVCQFICVHNDLFRKHTRIAVNIAAKQFYKDSFVSYVAELLDRYQIKGSRLEFEITESAALQNIDDAISKMGQLQALGISFSLDDFGTGYSSLSYLKKLPVDKIKIDRSFINDINVSTKDTALVASIISIAKNLGLLVVAEGVETQEQVDWLSGFGDVILQGYHFSRPITHGEFASKYLH